MEELCEILSEYEEIMKSYRVDAYRVYAGAFLKDAGNVLFVLERIRIRTGLTLQILSNSERHGLSDISQLRPEKNLMP